MKAMEAQKTISMVFGRSCTESRIAPLARTARRFFGLDVGDWSIVLFGVALVGLMLALI
jgi:hypothetical protein